MIGSTGAVWLAALAFLGLHAIPSTPLRGAIVRAVGEPIYLVVFSILAAAALFWLGWAYTEAPFEYLWAAPSWALWIPLIVMPFAFFLLACGLTTRNPTAVMAQKLVRPSTPTPGIFRITRHPVMWGFALWGLSHMPANGEQASLVLFGTISLLALSGMPVLDRRAAARLGPIWQTVEQATSVIPFLAVIQGRTTIRWWEIGLVRAWFGGALYLIFLFIHGQLFGISPWPG